MHFWLLILSYPHRPCIGIYIRKVLERGEKPKKLYNSRIYRDGSFPEPHTAFPRTPQPLSQNPTPCGWIMAELTLELVAVAFFPRGFRSPVGMA
jgi:hypothetical protein